MPSEQPLPARLTRTSQPLFPWRHFTMCFSSTPRGARLARRLAGERLEAWGIPYGSDAHDVLTLIVAELSANAVRHGRVPGRDFRLRLSAEGASLRVEVTDSRGESVPALADPSRDLDGRRGLLLVAALTDRWGWYPSIDGPGKTVWAVLDPDLGSRSRSSRPLPPLPSHRQVIDTIRPGDSHRIPGSTHVRSSTNGGPHDS